MCVPGLVGCLCVCLGGWVLVCVWLCGWVGICGWLGGLVAWVWVFVLVCMFVCRYGWVVVCVGVGVCVFNVGWLHGIHDNIGISIRTYHVTKNGIHCIQYSCESD